MAALKNPKKTKKEKSKGADSAARRSLESIQSLILLPGIFEDEVGSAFVRFLKWLSREEGDSSKGFRRYGKLWRAVMEGGARNSLQAAGNTFQDHLLERLLENANPFHLQAEVQAVSQISPLLKKPYQKEMGIFREILKSDWEGEFRRRAGSVGSQAPSWSGPEEAPTVLLGIEEKRKEIKSLILSNEVSNGEAVSVLGRYFFKNGWGPFGRHRAFRWIPSEKGGELEGIDFVDPVRLENLVGYDEARKALLENIEGFVAGKGANNTLIYGERGTGKSSTVKALLNAHADRGLRLVEIHPEDLRDYPRILKPLRGRKEKFILFVDDLSFEENETSYKGLKALLEGTVEATPTNVILVATSNRRHLVREFFQDRSEGVRQEGEVHGQDTVEEKLSLSDRFGLVVSFYSPDQDTYLSIVENWARVEGLKIPSAELRAEALRWALANNGRSGRSARQFVNHLKGRS